MSRVMAADYANRGYHVFYRPNETNHCPGCGRSHWYIGRQTAECAFCGTAISLQETVAGSGTFKKSRQHNDNIKVA